MCGIAGGADENGIEPRALVRALEAIRHRGPDDCGKYIDRSVALGMRRLAIIDVAGGVQPISSEDGNVLVVFNGEIYNYREIREDLIQCGHVFKTDSDTEVLVHLYEQYGTEMCTHLHGMFAFAIWDKQTECLFLGRDRFGKKPLYFRRTASGGILFASEIKALRALAPEADWAISDQAVSDYLSLGYVQQPDTIFASAQMVPAASWLQYCNGTIQQGRYWSLDFSPSKISYREAREKTQALIANAVRVRLRSDVPLGVFLSGGIDSSIVAYEAARVVGDQLSTFTVAVPDASMDESAIAIRTAKSLNVRNHVLHLDVNPYDILQQVVRQYDQPFADSSAIPSFAVSKMAREHVSVVLNGDGGDEVFAGYRRHVAAHWSSMFDWLPPFASKALSQTFLTASKRRRSTFGFAARLMRGLNMEQGRRYLAWTSDQLFEDDKRSYWKRSGLQSTEQRIEKIIPSNLTGLQAQLAADMRINLLSDLLVKMDIATMAHSLEARSPLLDHRLVEFVATLPSRFLVRGSVPKWLLRDAYRDRLPAEVIRGKKRGFEIPMQRWLKGELRDLLFDSVGSPNARVKGFLDSDFVDEMLKGNALPDRNRMYITYSLLVLELWLRNFEEQSSARLVA